MFSVGIGLRDPRSQKRDLGHPSISPLDIAEGTSFVIERNLGICDFFLRFPLLSAVFEDLFRQMVLYLGLIAHHFVVGSS